MKTVELELSKLKVGESLEISNRGYAKIQYLLNGKKVKPVWVRDVSFCSPPVEVFYIKQLDKMLYVYKKAPAFIKDIRGIFQKVA